MAEPVRFVDVLTTASAVANYLGEGTVTAAHVAEAVAIVLGEKSMEDLGQPVSPMLRRGPVGPEVSPRVRELARRWFDDLGGDPAARLDAAQIDAFRTELRGMLLEGDETGG